MRKVTSRKIYDCHDVFFTILNKNLNDNFCNDFISGTMRTFNLFKRLKPHLSTFIVMSKTEYEREND